MSLLSLQLQAGAVSGGGGGTTNPDPVSKDRIARSLFDIAAPALITWFNKEESEYLTFGRLSPNAPKALERFLSNSDKFKETIIHLQVDLMQSVPCLDLYGRENDASIHSVNEGSICMSAHTMAPKLNRFNVDQEVVALLAHEVAHLFGADEEEAHELQIYVLEDLHRNPVRDMKFAIERFSDWSSNYRVKNIREISKAMLNRPEKTSASSMDRLREYFMGVSEELYFLNSGYGLLDAKLHRVLLEVTALTYMLEDFTCMNEDYNDLKDYCAENFEKGFGGKEQIGIFQYLGNIQGYQDPRQSIYLNKKLTNYEELKAYAVLFDKHILQVMNYVHNLKYEQVGVNRVD